MQSITFNITNPAAYDILLQFGTKLAGVELAETAAVAICFAVGLLSKYF